MRDELGLAKENDGRLIDLSRVAGLARQHLWPMLAAAGIVIALTVAAFLLADKVYEARAVVALERTEQQIIQTDDQGNQVVTDSPSVDTEVQVLLSPGIAEAAVRNARLDTNPAFKASLPANGGVEGALTPEQAANWVRSNLTVSRQGLSYAIEVAYKSQDPAVAALVANAVSQAYVNGQVDTEEMGRNRDIALLRDRLDQLRSDVLDAETDVARYRASTNLVDIADDNTIAQQEISTLNTQLAQARADLAAARANARVNAGGSGSTVNNSSVVANLRVQQAQLAAQQAELAERYGPLHPDRTRNEAELASVNDALARETRRTASGVGGDAIVAANRVGAIEGAIARAQGELVAGNNASVRLNELERIAESARQLYQTFLDRYRTELATQGTEQGRAYIISPAQMPASPSSPDPLVFILGGIVAALAAAGLVALVAEWRERGFRTREEAENHLGFPVLAAVPDLKTVRGSGFRGGGSREIADYLADNDGSVFNEALRSIRTSLKIGQAGQLAKTVAITSPQPDEGKTTVAICLARSAAMAGHRTLLIDGDLRRHSSSRTMASGPRAGLIELLEGSATLDDVLLVDDKSGAMILPQTVSRAHSYDIVQSTQMQQLLETVAAQFDLVVIDTAPVIPVAESRAIAAMTDATILTVRWRKTGKASAAAAVQQLRRAGATIFGTVLTRVDLNATASLGADALYYEPYEAQA